MLPSFNTYKIHRDNIENKMSNIFVEMQETEEKLAAAQKNYSDLFAQGQDLSSARVEVHQLKAKMEQLAHEKEILASGDFRKKEVLRNLHDEFINAERNLLTELQSLHAKGEELKERLRAEITLINEKMSQVTSDFRTNIGLPFMNVIPELEVSDNIKSALRYKAESPQFAAQIQQI